MNDSLSHRGNIRIMCHNNQSSAAILIQSKQNKDIAFCRNAYAQLTKGSQSAIRYINWDDFKVFGYDVAGGYKSITNYKERLNYKSMFIKGFSMGFTLFKENGGTATNWRIYYKNDDKVVVSCDYPKRNQRLLLTISKSGPERKLTAIEWGK